MDAYCPSIALEAKRVSALPEVVEVTRRCRDLFKILTKKLGSVVDSIEQVDYAYDYFKIQVRAAVVIK